MFLLRMVLSVRKMDDGFSRADRESAKERKREKEAKADRSAKSQADHTLRGGARFQTTFHCQSSMTERGRTKVRQGF